MYMMIDAQAIEHLELLEVGGRSKNVSEGSFFDFLARGCSTGFGKRLLKRWVVSPLQNKEKIEQRLDAVQDLVRNPQLLDKLQLKLANIPDLERMLSKIYTYSIKAKVKAIYIDIAIVNRLDEFYKLIGLLKKTSSMLEDIFNEGIKKKLESKRLIALSTLKELDFANANEEQ